MAKRQKSADTDAAGRVAESPKSFPSIAAAELLSFLKEIHAAQTWTEKDLAKALSISVAQADEAIAVLQLQGYIEPAGRTGKWRVTEQGDVVSGAKSPRFTRRGVQDGLDKLRNRIKAINEDPNADYKITDAVAFGDFLGDAARVQAEVGIQLAPKNEEFTGSAKEHRAELAFLKQLRRKSALLHVVPYEEWMSARSHLRLL